MTTTAQQTRMPPGKPPRQLPALLRAAHPKQALAFAVVVGALVALTRDDAVVQALASAVAVLIAQLAMGLTNDLFDVDLDRAATDSSKPIATGVLPAGNASFAIAVLLLVLIPLALQNGVTAGLFLLSTLVIGFVHNRWLHRTPLSFVGWVATFALLTYFVTLGGWAGQSDGSAPLTTFVVLCGVLGLFVHLLTSLPDLVRDNQARVRHLPLRIALHTGATKLLVIAGVGTVLVLAALVYTTLQAGAIAQ